MSSKSRRNRPPKTCPGFPLCRDHRAVRAAYRARELELQNGELRKAVDDVLRHATDTVWVGDTETLVDRMVSLGVYGHGVYEGERPWEEE